ncbi:TonB-linked outer membrane protein, SusC/RagA family [Filimonas lacunae]|uniref:TonB-linked outer membrane protein, SusC/RagA family n=1 Tax=Filimonas lacunae TaxID=477680 RepID=A0A173MBW8_9BACT|nr:TonB-dependent receptor [Filimonas lacunae]BAV04979.1 TonB-dependent receptor [Filimonas lacunae]SIT33706.1 TonB-linked outer membrane protein, SusC/RagA family [Filimonas lacunae]
MRVSYLLMIAQFTLLSLSMAKDTHGQDLSKVVSVQFHQAGIKESLLEIQRQSGIRFILPEKLMLAEDKKITFQSNGISVQALLDRVLDSTDLAYRTLEGYVVIDARERRVVSGKLTGVIRDEKGNALAGAGVRIVELNQTIQTDVNGSYIITLKPGTYTVEYTYVSYQRQVDRVLVEEGKTVTMDITLKPANNLLTEVVVSYGKQRLRNITGSVAAVDAGPMQDMPVMQFAQQLQGKVAGVQVAQTSGQPGRGMGFVIRGAASFYSSNQPLFVIDGLPITGSINNINPAEIESFSFLKDASATALYGSRAANGVVLITTKHAKPGDAKVEFSAYYGVQKIPTNKLPRMMNAHEFATYMKQRMEDGLLYEPGYTVAADYKAAYDNPDQYGEGTNWFKLLTRAAPIQSYDLSVRSAREHSASTLIAGYQEQQGVIINTGTRLFSLRFNQDFTSENNKLRVGFNLAPSYRVDHNNRLSTDGVGGYFERFFEASPLLSPYNADGSYARNVTSPGMVSYINPLATFNLTNDDYYTTRILANGYLNYEFFKGLSLKTNLGIDKGNETRKYFQSGLVTGTQGQTTGTSSAIDNGSWTAEANLVYDKTIATDHHIEALAGYSAQKFSTYSNTLTGLGYTSDDIPYLSAATSITGGSGAGDFSMLSYIGRFNYSFKNRYLLSAAFRNDGSSRFGINKQWGIFPSVSAGWVISEEAFMQTVTAIDFLKLRGSFGVTGNNNFPGNYDAQATIGTYYYNYNNTVTQGQTINRLPNADLRWERNKQLDFGIDVALLNNRISLTYDYYHKLTDGLIQQRAIPTSSGFSQILYNVGALKMWGHEFSISTKNLVGDLKWNTRLIVSFDRNLITNLVDPGYIRRNTTVSSDYYRQQVGHHLGEFYGFVFDGLYRDAADLANSPKYLSTTAKPNGNSDIGTIKVKDLSGDGNIDDVNDRTFIGDPTPTFTGGMVNSFTYKNFDFNIDMSFSAGGKILNAAKWAYRTNMDGSRNLEVAALDHWRSLENPGSGMYPRTKTGTTAMGRQVNSQWIESGSYLTAKNISLGYTLPVKGGMINKVRVYASVQQAFVWSRYSGMNPEINVGGSDPTAGVGIDENAYPIPRTFSIGFITTFK